MSRRCLLRGNLQRHSYVIRESRKNLILVSCKTGTVIEKDAFSDCDNLMPVAYR